MGGTFFITCLILIQLSIHNTSGANEDYGEALFLSDLLDAGKVEEAQSLAKVSPDIGNLTSYSGFLTVDKQCESFLFFWFVPAQEGDWKSAPVVFWQQGGPGTTSCFGMFLELGPFEFSKDSGLTQRKFSWNKNNNLLIIDNPQGVGFSFTRKHCYPTNIEEVGTILYSGLAEFYRLFPALQTNKLILSGESYAGKYLPVLAHKIHQNNLLNEKKINLTAVLMSGAFSDPLTQNPVSALYYQKGLIDEDQKDQYVLYENLCTDQIKNKRWKKSLDYCNLLTNTFFIAYIGAEVDIYNSERGSKFDDTSYKEFFESPSIRKALHVGKLLFDPESNKVANKLKYDNNQSVKPYVEELLPFYPFIFLNGEHDLICPYIRARKFLRSLNWTNQISFLNSSRSQWCAEDDMVGWYHGKPNNNLYDILVRSCGHFVIREQSNLCNIIINSIATWCPGDCLKDLVDCDNTG